MITLATFKYEESQIIYLKIEARKRRPNAKVSKQVSNWAEFLRIRDFIRMTLGREPCCFSREQTFQA